ncbi:DUF4410 domain-containing protein [Nitrosomonas sp. Nm33]|uniref:DUF4410 domain-containing protein n=2 Tax=Nitrosomonas sp. Nm33 TaxID=133724 RepID=UPI00089B076E|nr:DUF4410 domain-containing protein [Nitrosomonas sp. Nm33]SDY26421.1 protein of unknown function [Nitrosomonas sp. Nm33]
MKIMFFKDLMTLIIALLVIGCVQHATQTAKEPPFFSQSKPEEVLIYDFAVNLEDVNQNSALFAKIDRRFIGSDQTAEQIQIGREVADALAAELMAKIAAMGFNPVRATTNKPIGKNAIMITGEFIDIDEGHRLQRTVIGLGAGKSSLNSRVRVLAQGDSGIEELIAFDAHSESGSMPGAAMLGSAGVAAGAGTAAVVSANVALGAGKAYKSASVQQAKGMAGKIAVELAKYFASQGWIDPTLVE